MRVLRQQAAEDQPGRTATAVAAIVAIRFGPVLYLAGHLAFRLRMTGTVVRATLSR
jgi:hypothetical protein